MLATTATFRFYCGLLASLCLVLPMASATCSSLTAYHTANPHCTVSSDCLRVDCNVTTGMTASLTVNNCEDPVHVHLSLHFASTSCDEMFYVSGKGVQSENTTIELNIIEKALLNARYDRNTSHLQFQATVVPTDYILTLIPEVWVPLSPASCMCIELQNISSHVTLPIPVAVPSCAVDSADLTSNALCSGFHCNITYGSYTFNSHSTVDPCTESLTVRVTNSSSGQQVFEQVFNQTKSMPFSYGVINPTLYVILNHYNYSMEVAVIMNLVANQTIVAPQRIILDRSGCSSFTTFPAAPVPFGHPSTGLSCFNDSSPTAATTPNPPKQSIVAIAVAVPVTVIMVGCIITAILLTVVGLYFRAVKRRQIRFRRVAFDEMEDED